MADHTDRASGLSPSDQAHLDNDFSYHPPGGPDDVERYQRIREAGKEFAAVLMAEVHPGDDRSAAYRKIREAVMTANAAIACGPGREALDHRQPWV